MDDPDVVQDAFAAAAKALTRSTHVVALVGTTQPRQHRPPITGSATLWAQQADKPSAGHVALASLERDGFLHHLITQDTDGLQRRAGSQSVTEVHGTTSKLRCMECGARVELVEVPADRLPPRCSSCQGLMRPDAMMPGDAVPAGLLAACKEHIGRCDALLVLSTPGLVHPAANFPMVARARGAWLIEVSQCETPVSAHCDIVIKADALTALPTLAERVREHRRVAGVPPRAA